MRRAVTFTLAVVLSASAVLGQVGAKVSPDPDEPRFITSDIQSFWRAYDRATPQNQVEVFEREYFKGGTDGLRDFIALRINSADSLVNTINRYRKYYDSIRESTLRVESMRPRFRACFYALKFLYEDAVFPDVYFVIGRMSTGGTTSARGLLIGVEMYGMTPRASEAELTDWHKQVLRPVEDIPYIGAHELIHYQQKYSLNLTLLARSIHEGSADFIGEMISGGNINQHLQAYGNPREKELWEEFRKEMNGIDSTKWLYQGASAKDRPADLGYYVGYKITESYFNRAGNKKQAVRDTLNIKDFAQYLKESGYEAKFSK